MSARFKVFVRHALVGAGSLLGQRVPTPSDDRDTEEVDSMNVIGGDFRRVGHYLTHGIETAKKEIEGREKGHPLQLDFEDALRR